jgi:hypothetical protein
MRRKRLSQPEGGLFRAATISSLPRTGAEKSRGSLGTPYDRGLRLAWSDAPTPRMTSKPGGGYKEESFSGCGLIRDHPPAVRARR